MRRTVPPSVEIEAQIDQLLAVGVGENPRGSLSELEGTVEAFEADPAEPLLLWPVGEGLVRNSGWPLPADVVRMHDVQQLQDLGLVAAAAREKGIAFWPTPDGRTAIHNGAELLERRSATAGEAEASRLRRWAERLRAGDVAVGLVTGTAPAVIRALLGF